MQDVIESIQSGKIGAQRFCGREKLVAEYSEKWAGMYAAESKRSLRALEKELCMEGRSPCALGQRCEVECAYGREYRRRQGGRGNGQLEE